MVNYAYLIAIFPLIGFIINIFFGAKLKLKGALISIFCISLSFILSCLVLREVMAGKTIEQSIVWFTVADYSFKAGFLVDSLTAMMLIVVTLVSLMVQIYSIGYMHGEKNYTRFFAFISLFTFSMLGLVLANNLIEVYVFWELVGLCSYLLISYWYYKTSAADAGKKAFITTRIGDTGFFLGIAIIFYYLGTANFGEISEKMRHGGLDVNILTISAVLIFCGAIGKSAQFPLHVWLPDAMEGPTPASALIHAATMVAAGVYLVARSYALFAAAQMSLQVVSYIGIITALLAASIALVQNDIKRILAYSTVSQLGLMMVGLGVGGYTAASFHLMTHAFFKALLFLCAGAVIHNSGLQNIQQMGGLFGKMKTIAITCLIACGAIAGVPPLSGFWSKDEILLSIYTSGNKMLYGLTLLVSFMTAFYMFRLLFLTFFGKPRYEKIHLHKLSPVMAWPLIILASLSAVSGLIGSPLAGHYFSKFIYFHPEHHFEPNYPVMFSSIAVALGGIFLAWLFYLVFPKIPSVLASNFKPVYNLLLNKYWIDELYDRCIIQPFLRLTRAAFSFDSGIIDGAVNLTAAAMAATGRIKNWIDKYIVDGLVNGVAGVIGGCGLILRRLQTGFIQNYILLIFTSIVVIILFKLI
jgi:NADH-quinone oxidoreductase subunit L